MGIIAWYKSWFRMSGTLELKAYVKHMVAAFVFFFAFCFLGSTIISYAPAWAGFLAVLSFLALGILAVGSWIGIVITSTMRFVRHLKQR